VNRPEQHQPGRATASQAYAEYEAAWCRENRVQAEAGDPGPEAEP
jgi:hypothetical protein